jgi:hypothetical protein
MHCLNLDVTWLGAVPSGGQLGVSGGRHALDLRREGSAAAAGVLGHHPGLPRGKVARALQPTFTRRKRRTRNNNPTIQQTEHDRHISITLVFQ